MMKERRKETQVAIIGGGITGTAIARELSKYKIDACLLEKESALGWGVTKGSMAMIHGGMAYLSSRTVKYHGDSDEGLTSFLRRGLGLKDRLLFTGRGMYFKMAPYLHTKIIQHGRLMLAGNEQELERYRLIKQIAEEKGIKGLEMLDRDGIEEKVPLVAPRFIGGLFDPSEACVFPIEWVIAFADNARDNGVEIMIETMVTAINRSNGGYRILTNRGIIEAEYVVNAAGLFADKISAMIGHNYFSVCLNKCQLLVLENRDYIRMMVARMPKPGNPGNLLPTTEGNILVAHTMDPTTDRYDLNTTSEGLRQLYEMAKDLVPAISPEQDIISSFVSFLTYNTKDPDDHLLECPEKKFVNVVVGAPGLTSAPAMAQEVAMVLAEEGMELIEKRDFNPYRFKEPRFIELSTEEKNEKIRQNPRYGHIICRCEKVSEQEVVNAVRNGARTLDEVKFRTRAGMGRCQGGFCTSRVLKVMAREMGISPLQITKKGRESFILKSETKSLIEQKVDIQRSMAAC
jgi:glycerol-3-phosphate dehydrogenase